MSWLFEESEFINPLDYFGFVYIIENKLSGKKYIGKKHFFFKKYKQVKGKRKGFFIESDWKEYWGSSDKLKEEIENVGIDNFSRKIVKLCKSKAECTYWESKMIFEFDALLHPEHFYNEWIMCRVRRSHLTKK